MHTHAGNAPREVARKTALVYLRKDGRIVHRHEQVTLEGGRESDRAYVEQRAIEHAGRAGHQAADLAVLHLEGEEMKRGTRYSVDPQSKRLIEMPAPER